MYYEHWTGFYLGVCVEVSSYVDLYKGVELYDEVYVGVCAEIYLYIDLYKNLEVYDGREAGLWKVCLGACVRYKRKTRLFIIH